MLKYLLIRDKSQESRIKIDRVIKDTDLSSLLILISLSLLLLLSMNFSKEDLLKEITFKTSRSGGKGGQNVNKVSSKVELNINIKSSALFTEEQKITLSDKLSNRINSEGVLQIVTEEDRSQLRNKEKSVEKLIILLKNALHKAKVRKPTKPGRSTIEKRLKFKQAVAIKKINRRSDHLE